jgi:hypothetical protein
MWLQRDAIGYGKMAYETIFFSDLVLQENIDRPKLCYPSLYWQSKQTSKLL